MTVNSLALFYYPLTLKISTIYTVSEYPAILPLERNGANPGSSAASQREIQTQETLGDGLARRTSRTVPSLIARHHINSVRRSERGLLWTIRAS